MSLATLTTAGRGAIVKAIKERTLHIAWGVGLADWDEEGAVFPSLVDRTALFNEIGRRAITSSSYVTPDNAGDIVIPVTAGESSVISEARYSFSVAPTPYLYVRAAYDFADASSAVIRELGVFMDTVVGSSVPSGQHYVTPAQLTDSGILLAMQIVTPPINRSPSVRQTIEFVLPI